MARTAGSSGPKTLQAIRDAGVGLIYEHGYHGMNLRQLAAAVGIQQGSLYNHIRTKQELLFDLVKGHMKGLLDGLAEALADVRGAQAQLETFVSFHVNYHFTRNREVFISYSELRSLEPGNYAAIVALRKAYESRLVTILEAGRAEGVFEVSDTKVAAYGLLGMLAGICDWFKPTGRLTASEVKAIYARMVLGAVTPAVCAIPPRLAERDRLSNS